MKKTPPWLSDQGKKLYKKLQPVVTEDNEEQVMLLVHAWQVYVEAEERIKQDGRYIVGNGNALKAHPAVAVQGQAFQHFMRAAKLLGLNNLKPDTDPLEEYL